MSPLFPKRVLPPSLVLWFHLVVCLVGSLVGSSSLVFFCKFLFLLSLVGRPSLF